MSTLKNLTKIFTRVYDGSVEISDKGVLRVDASHLLTKASVKRQLQAVGRLQRTAVPARQRKTG